MKKASSASCFRLAVVFAAISIIWFNTVSFACGMVMAVTAFLELLLGFYRLWKEKNGN